MLIGYARVSTQDQYLRMQEDALRSSGCEEIYTDIAGSGFVEGLNNKIKTIKRRCYGLLSVETLFQRVYLDLEGYGIYA